MCSAFNTSGRNHYGFNPTTVVPIDLTENNIQAYNIRSHEIRIIIYPLHVVSRPPAVPFDFSFLSHLCRFLDDTGDLSAIGNLLTDLPTSFPQNLIKTNQIFAQMRYLEMAFPFLPCRPNVTIFISLQILQTLEKNIYLNAINVLQVLSIDTYN